MEYAGDWVLFKSFHERSAASALTAQLEADGCPAWFEARSPENAIETDYCVFVPQSLAHRARCLVAQLPVSDEELEFLATGRLPGHSQDK